MTLSALRRTALAVLSLLQAACTGLPDVLADAPENAHALPAPEDTRARRGPRARAPQSLELANGMSVVLLEDRSAHHVVVDLWLARGSDGAVGALDLAPLLVALLSPGPGDAQLDALTAGGASFHCGGDAERTRCFALGPGARLAELLDFTARRIGALASVTQAEVERARESVRLASARGVSSGDALESGDARFSAAPPARCAAPGERDGEPGGELAAATLEDVRRFLMDRAAPARASLVVAGDFERAEIVPLLERTLGTLPRIDTPAAAAAAEHAEPPRVERMTRLVEAEAGEGARLVLAWRSPAAFAPGDAELELLAVVLAEGPAARLDRRLVLETRLAREIEATQRGGERASEFVVEALTTPGADVEALEREVRACLAEIARDGPTREELAHAIRRQEARFLRRIEGLLARAEAMQRYRRAFGVPDGFRRDLERRTRVTAEDVRDVARAVLAPGSPAASE